MTTSLARCTKLTSKALLRSSQEDSHPVHPGHLHVPFSLIQSPSDHKSVLCHVYIFKSCHIACPQVLLVVFMSSSDVTSHVVCTSSSDLSCLIDVHRQVSLMFTRIHIKCYLSYLHVCHQTFVTILKIHYAQVFNQTTCPYWLMSDYLYTWCVSVALL